MARQATLLAVGVLVGALVGVGLAVGVMSPAAPGTAGGPGATGVGPTDWQPDPGATGEALGDGTLQRFGSESAFRAYVSRAADRPRYDLTLTSSGAPAGGDDVVEVEQDAPTAATGDTAGGDGGDAGGADTGGGGTGAAPDRIGETNVQVAGLDEPDRVKTDGSHFYYAPWDRNSKVVVEDGEEHRVREREPRTSVIDASEPADPTAVAAIEETGRLLQSDDRLLVLQDDRILGYDVSDPAEPARVWTQALDDRLVTARERDGTVYLVTRTPVHEEGVCPLTPLGGDEAIPCGDVYRPGSQVPVDATYTTFAIDATDGSVQDSVSVVGTNRHTAVYMSHDALYLTYTDSVPAAELRASFLLEAYDGTPEHVAERIREIQSYNISARSKRHEIRTAVKSWLDSLDDDRRATVEAELTEGYETYLADRQRDITRTGIVRVDVAGTDLAVESTGTVPGRPLDQFSMGQHDGVLSITTTIPGAGSEDSANDLYTLDARSLERLGNETGMGQGQEVYAVRYVEDTAYVVTFRRIDPFHVVDLSTPSDPTELGELELPGFSSYLHPIDEDHVLGIGEEDGQVKTVLFDVSDPANPRIADDRLFDARWSAVSDSHHAFTIDRRHGVVVLPAGETAHVVDYANGSLDLAASFALDARATRSRYVGDSLYLFAGSTVTVVDETTWERTRTLDLSN